MEIENKELELDKYHIILGLHDISRLQCLDTIKTLVDGMEISIKIPDIK